ncbi:MAG TPA: hypothetical protein VFZ59_16125 [Verrucomicrobiae bacterium]|nr:hypothetical protein [Verrucomicrobiae bacterium]
MSKAGQRRVLFVVVATLIIAGLLVVRANVRRPVSRLANGTQLSLRGVTQGPTNTLFPGGRIDALIYQFISPKGIHVGPVNLAPAPPLSDDWRKPDGSPAFPTKAVIWIGHHGPTNLPLLPIPESKWFRDIRATLADETGEEWETRVTAGHQARQTTVRGLNAVTPWSFSSFPRRGKKLRFRIYSYGTNETWDTLADFSLANPAPGPYPVWTSPALPAVQTNGNLVVALVQLVSGRKSVPYYPGARQFTRAVFEVKEDGQVTTNWLPDRMEATDATGNEPWVPMVNFQATNQQVFYEMQAVGLSATEVWKLKTRFTKTGDHNAERTWTSPELPVTNDTIEPVSIKTNWQAGVLVLETSDHPFPGNLRLDLAPLPDNAVLRLDEFVDDRGRSVTYEAGSMDDSGFHVRWKIPAGAKWVRVTMRLAETRTLKFLAQPTRQ